MASIVGVARHEEELRVRAGRRAGAAAGGRRSRRSAPAPSERGEPIDAGRLALLGSVLEAFWWQRYTAAGDGAMSPEQVERVVDDVLLPIVSAERVPAAAQA